LAKEAIGKIKAAEDSGNEKTKKASEDARRLVKAAEADAAEKQKEILQNARQQSERLLDQARAQALAQCKPLITEGDAAIAAIRNPDPAKMDKAVGLVVERIVSGIGNS